MGARGATGILAVSLVLGAACSRASSTGAGDDDVDVGAGDGGPVPALVPGTIIADGGPVDFDGGALSAGESVITTLAVAGNEPNGLSVEGDDLYFASVSWTGQAGPPGYGWLLHVSTSGGPVTVVDTANLPYGVVAEGDDVYWTALPADADAAAPRWNVVQTPRRGRGTVTRAGPIDGLTSFTSDETHLYFAGTLTKSGGEAQNALWQIPFSGGDPSALVSPPGADTVDRIGAGRGGVAFTLFDAGTLQLASSPTRSLGRAPEPEAIAVAADAIFWTSGGSVMRVDLDTYAVTTIVSYDGGIAGPLALDADDVYWSGGGGNAPLQIAKAPIGGGAVTTIATLAPGWGDATALAVDDASVYWAISTPGCGVSCAVVQKATPK